MNRLMFVSYPLIDDAEDGPGGVVFQQRLIEYERFEARCVAMNIQNRLRRAHVRAVEQPAIRADIALGKLCNVFARQVAIEPARYLGAGT
ncbi:hypothetical protein [Trinickia dabaoshanensis]|uniref:hypothetical protein n=1 Tax=Trinickia dabaoshanensis TaxID=564714 RepID=UPI0011AFBC97|nr:hypothetical protein [Trinickia dabaoshanensis]